jgi:transcriptional regulator with XRE-family HTH domain
MTHFIDDDLVYKLIGEKVKKHREASNITSEKITQQTLAEALDVSRVSIANYEAGTQAIYISDLYKIADYLQVDIFEFLPQLNDVKIASPEEKLAEAKNEDELTKKEFNALNKIIQETTGDNHEE